MGRRRRILREVEGVIDMSSFSESEPEKKKPKRMFKRKTNSTADFFDMTNNEKKEEIDFDSFLTSEDDEILVKKRTVVVPTPVKVNKTLIASPAKMKAIQVEEDLELSDLNAEEMIKLQQLQQKPPTTTKITPTKATVKSFEIYLIQNETKETYLYKTTLILQKYINKKYNEPFYLKQNNEIITTQPILTHSSIEIILASQIQDIKIFINSNLPSLHQKIIYIQKQDKVLFLLNLLCHQFQLNKNDLIVKFNGTKLYSNVIIQSLCKDVITLDIQTGFDMVDKRLMELNSELVEVEEKLVDDFIVIKVSVSDQPKVSIKLRKGEKLDEFLKQVEIKIGQKCRLFFDGDELDQSILDDDIEKGDCLDAKLVQ
jgi:hypothetical protein